MPTSFKIAILERNGVEYDMPTEYNLATALTELGISAAGTITETITLNSQNIQHKYLTLSLTPIVADEARLIVAGGIEQVYGTDFEIVGKVLQWNGLGLDGILQAGDTFIITYAYQETESTTETFVLNSTDISNKQLTLSGTASLPSQSTLTVANGVGQIYNVDFIISGNVLSWNGLGLDGFLQSGDVIIVSYR